MPRKYHRPPSAATKRRKTRKSTIPYEIPQEGEGVVTDVEFDEDEALDEEAPLVAIDVTPDLPEEEDAGPLTVTKRRAVGAPERHVNRDYSYVRAEVVRIALLAGFLVVALAITAYFR